MRVVRAADLAFDVAVVCAVLSFVGFVWTFDLLFLRALATFVIEGCAALWIARAFDKPEPKKQPVVPRPKVRRDTVSDEEFQETLIDTGLVGRSDSLE